MLYSTNMLQLCNKLCYLTNWYIMKLILVAYDGGEHEWKYKQVFLQ